MPLNGRGVGAGLHHHVFGCERGAEVHGRGADGAKAIEESGATGEVRSVVRGRNFWGEVSLLHQHRTAPVRIRC